MDKKRFTKGREKINGDQEFSEKNGQVDEQDCEELMLRIKRTRELVAGINKINPQLPVKKIRIEDYDLYYKKKAGQFYFDEKEKNNLIKDALHKEKPVIEGKKPELEEKNIKNQNFMGDTIKKQGQTINNLQNSEEKTKEVVFPSTLFQGTGFQMQNTDLNKAKLTLNQNPQPITKSLFTQPENLGNKSIFSAKSGKESTENLFKIGSIGKSETNSYEIVSEKPFPKVEIPKFGLTPLFQKPEAEKESKKFGFTPDFSSTPNKKIEQKSIFETTADKPFPKIDEKTFGFFPGKTAIIVNKNDSDSKTKPNPSENKIENIDVNQKGILANNSNSGSQSFFVNLSNEKKESNLEPLKNIVYDTKLSQNVTLKDDKFRGHSNVFKEDSLEKKENAENKNLIFDNSKKINESVLKDEKSEKNDSTPSFFVKNISEQPICESDPSSISKVVQSDSTLPETKREIIPLVIKTIEQPALSESQGQLFKPTLFPNSTPNQSGLFQLKPETQFRLFESSEKQLTIPNFSNSTEKSSPLFPIKSTGLSLFPSASQSVLPQSSLFQNNSKESLLRLPSIPSYPSLDEIGSKIENSKPEGLFSNFSTTNLFNQNGSGQSGLFPSGSVSSSLFTLPPNPSGLFSNSASSLFGNKPPLSNNPHKVEPTGAASSFASMNQPSNSAPKPLHPFFKQNPDKFDMLEEEGFASDSGDDNDNND